MRNWNSKSRAPATSKESSFYSTYEELKRDVVCFIIFPICSFYSTYEELKLVYAKLLFGERSRFYSTYEELKHDFFRVA